MLPSSSEMCKGPNLDGKDLTGDGSDADLNTAVDFLHCVEPKWSGRGAVDRRSCADVEARAVTLAHEHRSGEQATGKRAGRIRAGAEIIEGIETILDPRDRDPEFAVLQIVRDDEVVRNRVARAERAKGV